MSKKQTSKPGQVSSKKSKSDSDCSFDELEKIFLLMNQHQMGELEWETEEQRIVVRSSRFLSTSGSVAGLPHYSPSVAVGANVSSLSDPSSTSLMSSSSSVASAPVKDANLKEVRSPFVGTFYRSSTPGKDPYVKEGSSVRRGDVLCIIEAMKLMNEIESEFQGKIKTVLVENGQPVEFGEPLFLIET